MKNYHLKRIVIIICMILLLYDHAEAKFINTFIARISDNRFYSGDAEKLAKYDIIFCQKFHYDDIGGDTWSAIKKINSSAGIYVYYDINYVNRYFDNSDTFSLGNLGRYNNSRGHSMGSLNGNNPNFFLLDKNGIRIQLPTREGHYLLDFGNKNFQDYALEAAITDHVNQTWTADGVYADHCFIEESDIGANPAKYDTFTKWNTAMNSMINATTAGLNAAGQKFACNRGSSRFDDGYNVWLELDQTAYPADVVIEEGAFAIGYGSGDIQFFPEASWKRQVDILRNIKNSKVCLVSSSDLTNTSGSGIDNYGKSFTFWDALWYSLGSYLLGKDDIRNNSYLAFLKGPSTYNKLDIYYDEYDKIDLGKAISSYKISNINGRNIYWREFEKGYVYVNPTHIDMASISLPETCKQRTHANLNWDLDILPDINNIKLNAHRAAFLYKSNKLISLQPPINFRIIAKK